jgi:hypothetical protein
VGTAECTACGAMYGVLPESQAFVDAVFAEAERPPRPPVRGVSARWRGRFGQGPAFRSNERAEAAGELEIDYRMLGGREIAASVAAVGALLFVAWTFFRIGMQLWLLLPAALDAVLAYFVLGRLRMHARLRLAEGMLEYSDVRHGFSGRGVRKIPTSEIRQLYVAHVPETKTSPDFYELRVRKQDGDGIVLEGFLSPGLPLLMEALVERALGIDDQAEPGELDRAVPVNRPGWPLAPALIALGVICGVTAIAVERSSGALEPVVLDESPRESEHTLRFPMTLSFDAELSFSRNEAPGAGFPSIEATPRSATFTLELLSDKESGRVACDPHELVDPVIEIEEAGRGRSRYRIRGRMLNCSLGLEPGRTTLRAHSTKLEGASAAGLESSRIVPRFKRRLF